MTKTKILIGVLIILLILGGVLVSLSSLLKIPIFSDIFYRAKIVNLKVPTDPLAAKEFDEKLKKLGLDISGFSLATIPSVLPEPQLIEFSDVELTSWINQTCKEITEYQEYFQYLSEMLSIELPKPLKCPFKEYQVKFEEEKFITSFQELDISYSLKSLKLPLEKLPIKGDVTIFGKITKRTEKSIDLEVEKIYIGNLPLPEVIKEPVGKEIEIMTNKILNELQYLKIERLQIMEGKAVFEGLISLWFKGQVLGRGEVIVVFIPEVACTSDEAIKLIQMNGGKIKEFFNDLFNCIIVEVPVGEEENFIKKMTQSEIVKYAEPNYFLPDDEWKPL